MKKILARLLICLLTFPAAPSYFGTVKISDGTTTAGVDSTTGTLQSISIEHHEIHKGCHFACPDTALDLDAGASKYWLIKTPNTATRCHFTFEIGASKNGVVIFWGASDTGATGSKGTALQRYNNDRNNTTDTAFTRLFKNPTFSGAGATLGNMMYAQVVGTDGTAPTGNYGGQTDRNHEMILKQNTFYTVEFRAQTNDTRLSFVAHFYEE